MWGWIKFVIKEKKSEKKKKEYLQDYKLLEYKEFCESLMKRYRVKNLKELSAIFTTPPEEEREIILKNNIVKENHTPSRDKINSNLNVKRRNHN